MFAILVVLPLVVAALIAMGWKERPMRVRYVALAASLLTLLYAISLLLSPGIIETIPWFSFDGISFALVTSTLPINMMLLMVVATITPLIFVYSMGYMEVPSEQRRFYFEMCVFAAAMMLFAISASFVTLFVAWEMLGVTSYMLVGFWYRREHAPTAARKAITTILFGDILMLIGIALIAANFYNLDYSFVLATPSNPALYLPMLLILIAAFTKSAQFPFHEWLSDAMEGPTPVSAFLHSSTMVKAGVFLIALLLPIYVGMGLNTLILAVGLISAAIGATNALASRHIKKILAYSTIEDLGLMFVALGLNSIYAAIMLFFVQAFYKALLFMGSGAIMHANNDEEDIFKTYGSGTRKSIFIPIVIGVLSIAGVFPLSGFFGKALLGEAALANNITVYLILVLIELATSTYIFRWLFVPMRRYVPEVDSESAPANYNSVPRTMIYPMFVLSILVFGATAAYFVFPSYLIGAVPATSIVHTSVVEFVAVTLVAAVGFLLARHVYVKNHRFYLASRNKTVYALMNNNVITNAVYLYITVAFTAAGAALGRVDRAFDKATYTVSNAVVECGRGARYLVNGQTNSYVLAFVVGFAILLIIFVI